VSAAVVRTGESAPALLDGVVQPLRTIVALAELSPKSDNAVARAALLAREHGAALRLLHVVAARNFAVAPFGAARDDETTARVERAQRALFARMASTQGAACAPAMRSRSSSTRRGARISSSSPPSAAMRCATSC
jgi:nucleotide-binding universal stress UspA family protein